MPDTVILKYGNLKTASRARSSNVATLVFQAAHRLTSGAVVDVLSVGGSGYNATNVTITVTNPTTITYANTGGNETTTADTAGRVWSRRTYYAQHVMGIDEPDRVQIVNPVMQQSDDGTSYRYADAFKRLITINLGVVEDKIARVFLWNFFTGTNNKKLDYSTETDLMVEFQDVNEFLMNWRDQSVLMKEVVLNLVERTARTSNPTIFGS
jgi:hypothetical protein